VNQQKLQLAPLALLKGHGIVRTYEHTIKEDTYTYNKHKQDKVSMVIHAVLYNYFKRILMFIITFKQ